MTVRKADAVWKGSLREGAGELALESGAFRGPYTFKSRFEQGKETNPEELLGAAHAGCFTMALTAALGREKVTPTEVHTTASVHLEQSGGCFQHHQDRAQDPCPGCGHPGGAVRCARRRRQAELPGVEGTRGRRDHAGRCARLTSSSSIVRGQSSLSRRASERSDSSRPPVWQRGQ